MSNEYPDSKQIFGCLSDDKGTSSSSFSRDENTNKFTRHVINLKEYKTHLFYLIQPDNENSENTPNLIRIKISKEKPASRNLASKKMLLRCDSNDDIDSSDKSETKLRKTQRPNIGGIHKRTDHPAFYVLPEILSKKRSFGSIKKKIDRNQSTSDNSNETYIVRSKEDQSFESFVDKPIVNPKSEDYCECGKDTVIKSKDQSNSSSYLPKFQQSKSQPIVSANNKSTIYSNRNRISDELFKIKFVEPTQVDNSQRLRAGQDRESHYKSCYVCPNMTRIFPQTGSRRRSAPKSNYPDSNSSTKNCNGYVKINYKLVRHCLIYGSINEKCDVLNAIRLRMKSPDLDVATKTVEDIVKFDLFGVQCECRSKPLLEELFWPINVPTPYPLQTSIARFVNAMVSFKIGRSYFNNRSIIHLLTWGDIGRDNIDETMGDNLIGIMMKLSCNRSQWSDMIKSGLFHWVLTHMEEVEYSASKYHVTMMTGLFRNLLEGQNINDLSPIEIQKSIVLLGRYLDTENSSAKRYICDSLMTLFQKREIVTAAKQLNFSKIIEEHMSRAGNSKLKEHLRAVNQMLNGSGTSFNNRKFDSLTADPFLDSDLEPNAATEIDYYPGECLLKDKFSGNEEVPRDKNNFNKLKKTNFDDRHNDGKLKSRVFVEHLNCFLPKIEKNRIFPLCNTRCADKIKTCSHIGNVQPKKRQPYIPPNSRTSGLPRHIIKQDIKWMIPVDTPWSQQSVDDTINTISDEDNKSAILQSNSNIQLENSEESNNFISRIFTISHDKSAARWNNFEKRVDTAETSVKSLCTDNKKVQRPVLKRSKTACDVDEGKDIFSDNGSVDRELVCNEFSVDAKHEKILRCVSYHNQLSKSAEILNESRDQDKVTSEPVALEGVIANRLSSKSYLQTQPNIAAVNETSCDNQISPGCKTSQTGTTVHIGQTDGTIIANTSVTKSEEGFCQINKEHHLQNSKSVDAMRKGHLSTQIDKITGSKSDTTLSVSRKNRKHISPNVTTKAPERCQESVPSTDSKNGHRLSSTRLNKEHEVTGRKSDCQSSGIRLNREQDSPDFKSAKALAKGQESLPDTSSKSDRQSSDTVLTKEHDLLIRKSVDAVGKGQRSLPNTSSKGDHQSRDTRLGREKDSSDVKSAQTVVKGQESLPNSSNKKQDRQSSGTGLNKEHDLLFSKSVDALGRGQESVLNNITGSNSERRMNSEDNFLNIKTNDALNRSQEIPLRKEVTVNKSDSLLPSNRTKKGTGEITRHLSDISISRSKDSIQSEIHRETIKPGVPFATETEHQWSSSLPTTQSMQNLYAQGSSLDVRLEEMLDKKSISGGKTNTQLLNARSEEVLSSKRNPRLSPETSTGHQMHARSVDILGQSKNVKELPAIALTKSKPEAVGALKLNDDKELTAENRTLRNESSAEQFETDQVKSDHELLSTSRTASDSVLSTKQRNLKVKNQELEQELEHELHARSEEVLGNRKKGRELSQCSISEPKENLSRVKGNHLNARSEEVLGSKRNLKLSRGHTAKESSINKVTMPHQLHARSAEILRSTNEVRESSLTELTKSNWKNTSKTSDDVVGSNKRDSQLSSSPVEKYDATTRHSEITNSKSKNISGRVNENTFGQTVDTSKAKIVAGKETQKIIDVEQHMLTDETSKRQAIAGRDTDELLDVKRQMFADEVSQSGAVGEEATHKLLDAERQVCTDEVTSGQSNDFNQQGGAERVNITITTVSNEKLQFEMCGKSPNRTNQENLTILERQTTTLLKDDGQKITSGNEGHRNEMLSKSEERSKTLSLKAKLITEDETSQGASRRKSLEEIHSIKINDQTRHTKSLDEVTADVSVLLPQPSTELKEQTVYEDMLDNPKTALESPPISNIEHTESLTKVQSNCQLLKPTSEEVIKSNAGPGVIDNPISEMTQLFFARSEEIIVRREKSRRSDINKLFKASQDRNQIAGLTSGYSSDSSIFKSRDCVDCEGTGTVLRVRASQPCENCKTSLSTYRKFVEVLNHEVSPSEDDQQRVVTRTSDEAIKVSWINNSKETPIANKDQDKTEEDDGDAGKLDEKKSSADLNRDTDAGDSTKSKRNNLNEEVKKSLSENERQNTTTEKSEPNQAQVITLVSESKEQPVDDQQKSTKDVTITTTDQISPVSTSKEQSLGYIKSGSKVTPQSSDIKEKMPMPEVSQEIVVSLGEIQNVSPKLSDQTSGVKNEVNASSKITATGTDKRRDNLMITNDNETLMKGATDGAKDDGSVPVMKRLGELQADKLVTVEIPKDKGANTSQNQSHTLNKTVRQSKSDKPLTLNSVTNTAKALVEPLLNTSRIDKHLSFGAVSQPGDIEKHKFVGNIIGETVTSSDGNECLQTTVVRKSSTVGVEESIESDVKITQILSVKNDLFDPVKMLEEQAVEIENAKLSSSDHQDLNRSMDKRSTQIGLSARCSNILAPRSIEIITDKVFPSPDNVLESIKKEERDIYSSHHMEEEFVEAKTEKCLLVSPRKPNEQTMAMDTSNELVNPMEHLDITKKLSIDVSESSVEKLKEMEASAMENELSDKFKEKLSDKSTNEPALQSINKKERDKITSEQYPLVSIKKSNDQTVAVDISNEIVNPMEHLHVSKKLTRDVSTSSVGKLKNDETNGMVKDLPETFKGMTGTQSITQSEKIPEPVSLEVNADNEVRLKSSEIQTDMNISRIDNNENLSVSELKQSENIAEATRKESTAFYPTSNPASPAKTSKEQADTSNDESKPKLLFKKRSNEEGDHSSSESLVINSKVSCVRVYQSLSEEKLATETNATEQGANSLHVTPEIIEHSVGCAESSQILSALRDLRDNAKDEAPKDDQHLSQHHLASSQIISSAEKLEDEKLENNQHSSQTQLLEDAKRIQSTSQKSTSGMTGMVMNRSISNQFLTEFPANHSNPQEVVMMFARSIEVVTDKQFNRQMTKREWKGGAKHSENVADKREDSRRIKENIRVISMSNSLKQTVSGVKGDQSDTRKMSEQKTEENLLSLAEKSGEGKIINLKSEDVMPELKESLMKESIVEQSRQSNVSTVQQCYYQQSNYSATKSTDESSADINCDPTGKISNNQPDDSESKPAKLEVREIPCFQAVSATLTGLSQNEPILSNNLNSKSNVPVPDNEQSGLAQKDLKTIPALTETLTDETIVNKVSAQSLVVQQLSLKQLTPSLPENNQSSFCNPAKEDIHPEVGVKDQVSVPKSMVSGDDKITAKYKSGQHSSFTKNRQSMGKEAQESEESNTKSQIKECEQKSKERKSDQDHGLINTVRTCGEMSVSLDETIAKKLGEEVTCGAAGVNILSPRSIEVMPASSPLRKRKQDEVDCLKSKETFSLHKVNVAKRATIADKHLRKETKSMVSQKDGSKISVVSTTVNYDEILLEERILSSARPSEQSDRPGNTPMNQQLRDDNMYFSNVQRGIKEKSKVRVINSSCCRKLLDNDELINKLSEKVLQKLLTEIHMCGPNCKSPCGGLNPYYNTKEDNNQNSE